MKAQLTHVPKPWGHETLFAHTERYAGKLLFIKAGHQLSLRYHEVKDETIYLQSGRMRFVFEEEPGRLDEINLEPGDAHHIPTGRQHRMIADVALANGITFQSAPVCPAPDGSHFTCSGKATDGRAVTSEADQVTVAEVPAQYKNQVPPDAAETDPQIVIKINAGDATLYQGLVITVMDQNARTQ